MYSEILELELELKSLDKREGSCHLKTPIWDGPYRPVTLCDFISVFLPEMSEYWVSKKKYFCKYCDIYIADDAPSRQQHENGLRHKGNVERFIRGIYKAGEKHKKDLEEEKREMKRVEQVSEVVFFTSSIDIDVLITYRLRMLLLPKTLVQVWPKQPLPQSPHHRMLSRSQRRSLPIHLQTTAQLNL